jgi:hypothetical protein
MMMQPSHISIESMHSLFEQDKQWTRMKDVHTLANSNMDVSQQQRAKTLSTNFNNGANALPAYEFGGASTGSVNSAHLHVQREPDMNTGMEARRLLSAPNTNRIKLTRSHSIREPTDWKTANDQLRQAADREEYGRDE